MRLWTDRFKPHTPFHIARRIHIQKKWDEYRGRSAAEVEGPQHKGVVGCRH